MTKYTLLSLLLSFLTGAFSYSQTSGADIVSVPLSDPSRPAFLKVGLLYGSITVKGYSGKEVLVDAKIRKEESDEPGDSEAKTHGLRLIPNTSTGLTIEEEDNVVHVSTGYAGRQRTIDLNIQVPFNCSVKASTVNDGDIAISNVTGDAEISDINGSVMMHEIAGSAVVDAINGEIKVTFMKVDPQKSMSFSSLNGDIDVTFPSSLKANMRMKNEQGQIYSDFDIKMVNSPIKAEDNAEKKRGKYRVKVETNMSGTINGGGPEISFKNFNGDILIRKGK
jgi:hypothetical protein